MKILVKDDIVKWMPAIDNFIEEMCPVYKCESKEGINTACETCLLGKCGICEIKFSVGSLEYLMEEE